MINKQISSWMKQSFNDFPVIPELACAVVLWIVTEAWSHKDSHKQWEKKYQHDEQTYKYRSKW